MRDTETGVGLTPARTEVDLSERAYTFPLTIFNDTEGPRTISIIVAELGHELDGTPRFGDSVGQVELIDGEWEFTLGPGASRELTFRAAFPGQVALYASVLAQIAPTDPDQAIATRTQVASLLLLRGPRPWDQSISATDVGLDSDTAGARLFVDVENVGNAHVRPTGVFTVRQDGEVLATVELPGEAILPAYARRLSAPWRPGSDVTGVVEVEVELDDGSSLTRTVDFDEVLDRASSGGGDEATNAGTPAATLQFDGQPPAALPLAALILLLFSIGLLFVVWRRKKDAEEPSGRGLDAGFDKDA